jgi:hypothetical protein
MNKSIRISLLLFCLLATLPYLKGQNPGIRFEPYTTISDKAMLGKIETHVTEFMRAVNQTLLRGGIPNLKPEAFTSEAKSSVEGFWKSGKFYFPGTIIKERILTASNNSFQIRNIPILIEDDTLPAVIHIMPDGRISDFYVGLRQTQYNMVLNSDNAVDERRRTIILNFLEHFRSAYVLADIDYIETVFSDKALIITGKVVETTKLDASQFSSGNEKKIEYNIWTKEEYINRLRKILTKSNNLKLDFSEIEVMRHRKYPNFYGVVLKQDWKTRTYSDTGILFLLIQFDENNERPIIWIRTWQDPKITPPEDLFGLHSFRISGDSNPKN